MPHKIDQLANSLTREAIRELEAISHIDGWNHGMSQTAEVLAAVHNLGNRWEISNSAKPRQASMSARWYSGWDFIKQRFSKKIEGPKTAAKSQQMLKRRQARHG